MTQNTVPTFEKNGLVHTWYMNVPKSAVVKDEDGTVELDDCGYKSTHEGVTAEPNKNTLCHDDFALHGIEDVGVYVVAAPREQHFKL